MPDIFLSYNREDQAVARRFADAFKAQGFDVWWDATLSAGEAYDKVTEQALADAKAVVVLWSKKSVESRWVRAEATQADRNGTLVPVMIEPCKRPIMFELTHTAELAHWRGDPEDKAWLAFLSDVRKFVEKDGSRTAAQAPVTAPKASADRTLLRRPLVLGGIAFAAIAIVAAIGVFALNRGKAPPQSQRIAFFGFSTNSNDPAAIEIAETATNEAFQTLSIQQLDTASRADTTGVQQKTRIDRAAELGARFALSGEVNPETGSGRVSVTMRLEDVPARAALWEETFAEDAATPLPVAVRAASRATDIASCEVLWASRLGRSSSDKDLAAAIMAFCNSRNTFGVEAVRGLRKLSQLAPNDGDIHGVLVTWLVTTSDSATLAARPAQLAEAEQVLTRAMSLEPDGYFVAAARLIVGSAQRQPRAELEAILTTSLQRTPESVWEVYGQGAVNNIYGSLLMTVGRTRSALPYLRATVETGLYGVTVRYIYLAGLAAAGRPEAGELLQQTFARQPTQPGGSLLLSAAVLLGAGDADKLLASPPKAIAADVVRCWRGIHTAIKSDNRKAQADGAARTKACLRDGTLPYDAAVQALARLGDLDGAFGAYADQQSSRSPLTANPLFSPATRALRADQRFLPLVEKLGLMDYWRATKTQPDVCETEDVPVCRELKAAKP